MDVLDVVHQVSEARVSLQPRAIGQMHGSRGDVIDRRLLDIGRQIDRSVLPVAGQAAVRIDRRQLQARRQHREHVADRLADVGRAAGRLPPRVAGRAGMGHQTRRDRPRPGNRPPGTAVGRGRRVGGHCGGGLAHGVGQLGRALPKVNLALGSQRGHAEFHRKPGREDVGSRALCRRSPRLLPKRGEKAVTGTLAGDPAAARRRLPAAQTLQRWRMLAIWCSGMPRPRAAVRTSSAP